MHFPTPEAVARHLIMCVNDAGKYQAVYRHNELNPRGAWSKPALRNGATLCFGNYIVPIESYAPCLEATAHVPITSQHTAITYTPDPHCPTFDLIQLDTIGGADHQARLTAVRDRAILKTYNQLLEQHRTGTVKEIALRGSVSQAVVIRVLAAAGVDVEVTRGAPRKSRPHRFSSSYQYAGMLRSLHRAIQQCRSNATGECSFGLADLYDPTQKGGYPVNCPVTGRPLNWEETMSWFSPRIGRYDITKPYTPDNVLVVSKLARRLIDRHVLNDFRPLLRSYPEMAGPLYKWDGDIKFRPEIRSYVHEVLFPAPPADNTDTNTDA